jgi:hypothetical protein
VTRSILVALLTVVCCHAARAQAPGRPTRFEISGGLLMTGGTDFGSRVGALTANDPGDPDFALFKAATTLRKGTGVEGRLSVNLTKVVAVEGAFSWLRQTAETRVTADVEGVPDLTLTQKLDSYFIEGAAVVQVTSLAFDRGRGVPFVFAGGGYVRQLDDRRLLTGSGRVFDAGGGVKYFFMQRRRGFVRALGIRADGRVIVRSGGFDPSGEGGWRATWGLLAGVVTRF